MELLEIITDLQQRQNDIGEKMLSAKDKETCGYKLMKYQYQQFKNAIVATNNARMALPDDFRS